MSEGYSKIRQDVIEWNDYWKSFPTFQELFEVELFRRGGTHNMITENIQRAMFDVDLYHGVMWLQRCSEHDISWRVLWQDAVDFYEKEHGPQNSWVSGDDVKKLKIAILKAKKQKLADELADLESQIEEF